MGGVDVLRDSRFREEVSGKESRDTAGKQESLQGKATWSRSRVAQFGATLCRFL